ncbi:MAG: class IV adenylate cyclase [Patescibacteria group bacterium]
MKIEYEATFTNIDKEEIRGRLRQAGASLIKPEFLQKRAVFNLPDNDSNSWLRVRDEGDKITMSLKRVDGGSIQNQKETCFTVSDFEEAKEFLQLLGCPYKSYQETKREIWLLGEAEISLDEWPYLEPFVEIEAQDEASVKAAAQRLGFNYEDAYFGAVDVLYSKKYACPLELINQRTPRITFEDPNPFL